MTEADHIERRRDHPRLAAARPIPAPEWSKVDPPKSFYRWARDADPVPGNSTLVESTPSPDPRRYMAK
ncbi:MAG: hypothetical protein ABW215_05455 [Kibdelosporangium sp.]